MAVQQLTINQLSQPDREKLFKIVQECSNSMARIEGENEYIDRKSTRLNSSH